MPRDERRSVMAQATRDLSGIALRMGSTPSSEGSGLRRDTIGVCGWIFAPAGGQATICIHSSSSCGALGLVTDSQSELLRAIFGVTTADTPRRGSHDNLHSQFELLRCLGSRDRFAVRTPAGHFGVTTADPLRRGSHDAPCPGSNAAHQVGLFCWRRA